MPIIFVASSFLFRLPPLYFSNLEVQLLCQVGSTDMILWNVMNLIFFFENLRKRQN
jgi:hypothetical protein